MAEKISQKSFNTMLRKAGVLKSDKATAGTKDTGIAYWTRKGFKVTETGLEYVAKANGKKYPAVKGTTKDGKEMTLIATRGGNVYTSQLF